MARLPLAQRLATAKIGSLRQLATDRSHAFDGLIQRMGFLAGRQERERLALQQWSADLRWRMMPALARGWIIAGGMALIGFRSAFRGSPSRN
jgi:hypothetical protein